MFKSWFKHKKSKESEWTDEKLKEWIKHYVEHILEEQDISKDFSLKDIFHDRSGFIINEFFKSGYRLTISEQDRNCGIKFKSYILNFKKLSRSEDLLKEI